MAGRPGSKRFRYTRIASLENGLVVVFFEPAAILCGTERRTRAPHVPSTSSPSPPLILLPHFTACTTDSERAG
uniref:Uncharacterized protein n=1 Tax=Leersia perrieri TaxID=77586 RepID=A0A0D9VMQ3_9ORYZ